jgi:hypothetical protein
MVVGAVALDALPGRPWAGVLVAGFATVVAYAVLLRLLARRIIEDALGLLPVPEEHAARVGRLLGIASDRR